MRFFIVSYPLKLALKIITSLFLIALYQSNLRAIPAEHFAIALLFNSELLAAALRYRSKIIKQSRKNARNPYLIFG
jgi:hypothetical protein